MLLAALTGMARALPLDVGYRLAELLPDGHRALRPERRRAVEGNLRAILPMLRKRTIRPHGVASWASRYGRDPKELLYELMLEDDGRAMLLVPALNYSYRTCDPIYEMMHHPRAVLGLGDGGAHCGLICWIVFELLCPKVWIDPWPYYFCLICIHVCQVCLS